MSRPFPCMRLATLAYRVLNMLYNQGNKPFRPIFSYKLTTVKSILRQIISSM